MEIGIDSFASAMYSSNELSSVDAMEQLLDRIAFADEVGLDVFGIGENHKKEFLDSAPAVKRNRAFPQQLHARQPRSVHNRVGDACNRARYPAEGYFPDDQDDP